MRLKPTTFDHFCRLLETCSNFTFCDLWWIISRGKNQTFYGWPETVAQWVEVLLGASWWDLMEQSGDLIGSWFEKDLLVFDFGPCCTSQSDGGSTFKFYGSLSLSLAFLLLVQWNSPTFNTQPTAVCPSWEFLRVPTQVVGCRVWWSPLFTIIEQ